MKEGRNPVGILGRHGIREAGKPHQSVAEDLFMSAAIVPTEIVKQRRAQTIFAASCLVESTDG